MLITDNGSLTMTLARIHNNNIGADAHLLPYFKNRFALSPADANGPEDVASPDKTKSPPAFLEKYIFDFISRRMFFFPRTNLSTSKNR